MTSIERGFHPWQRLVHRLGTISPHRQIQLLCLISVATVAIMVAAVLGSLGPAHDSLRFSSENLGPTIERLDTARDKYVAATTTLVVTANGDQTTRASAITKVAALYSSGDAAWRAYKRNAAILPGELALQRSFEANRRAALDAGTALVSQPTPSAEQLAEVTRHADALRIDLNRTRSLYEAKVQQSLTESTQDVASTQRQILVVSIAAILVLLIAFGVASRSASAREERTERLDRELHEDAERNELEARLQRSLEMVNTEDAAYSLVGRALTISVPGLPAELLVADSSRAHFHQATTTLEQDGHGCPVLSPTDCPAATWGQTQIWTSSSALDACPYLQDRPTGACSAVCVPVSIGGKTVGVVHATGPDLDPPGNTAIARVELTARKVGERVGMLRAFQRSQTQAHTDPLTGLMNRRSLEEKVREVTESGRTYVAVYGDLDRFKQLNDAYGHDAGDQALRLFARVLRDTVRPNDLTSRYGGEEFVIVLPDTKISDAYAVINRLRERLEDSQSVASGPRFTASFGITAARPEDTFSQTLELADAALLKAKATGRDRIVISGTAAPDPPAVPPDDQPLPNPATSNPIASNST